VGIGICIAHPYPQIYLQKRWMQTDEAGFWGTGLNDLNEERQDLMDLGVLLRT